jgi:hypothetical protein
MLFKTNKIKKGKEGKKKKRKENLRVVVARCVYILNQVSNQEKNDI